MARYADLVGESLRKRDGLSGWDPVRIDLALPFAVLKRFPPPLRNRVHHAWILLTGRAKIGNRSAAVFHVLDGSHAYVARWLPGEATVVTCHDLVPLLQSMGRLGSLPGLPARRLITNSVRALGRVGCVIADSTATRADLCRFADVDESRTRVVYPPVDPGLHAAGTERATGEEGPVRADEPYLLHVGNNAFYKNRAGTLRIFTQVAAASNATLKMVGPPPGRKLLALAASLGVRNRVEFIIDPGDALLAVLYADAGALLFPSLYEGFGWPVLEAMSFGCPVVCSRAPSLIEIIGEAALSCEARDEAGMASECIRVLRDRELAARLSRLGRERAEEFSVEKLAEGLKGAYEQILAAEHGNR